MHPMRFADRDFFALADRALFWPERRALLVADLHLEKASWFAKAGQMLPPFDSRATLERLLALVERTDAREIWALGDSFHDDDGPERLCRASLAIVDRLATTCRMVWIAGNHDSEGHLPGDRLDEAAFGDLVLRHEAVPGEARYEISGHYHPKMRVHGGLRTVSRPCFATSPRKLVMPAFGALTGGLELTHPALAAVLGRDCHGWIATSIGLHCYPAHGAARAQRPVARRNRSATV